jgi:ribosomal peptide maturation radical SAM protein 1
MPWGSVVEPSIGSGILKSVLRTNAIGCDVLEAPMRLLRYVKFDTYLWMAQSWAAADFVFAREFEPDVTPEQLDLLSRLVQDWQGCITAYHRQLAPPDKEVERILRLRQEIVPQFLNELMEEVDFSAYSLVGFSCLFDQTIASLALARRIKRAYPGMMIAFGGYALHRPVGPALQKCFPEMDVIAYGDGEPVIVPLWEAACGLRPLSEVPNISFRDSRGQVLESQFSIKINLDDSPTPDYDDFFRQREQLRERHGVTIPVGEIPVESSRGCWYGQKSHCTFCGIDDETLQYRVKSAHVTAAQLDGLHRRYDVMVFRFADYIMPVKYCEDFLPAMARRGAPYLLHYETKSNLKASQIELCAKAGIRWLQPGIESFSSPVLKLMAKGVSAAQNVFTLFTITANRIFTFYNLIFGFPFEEPADYWPMVRLIPGLYHLVPPQTTVPVLVTRHAPLAEDPERFGARRPLRAHWRYETIFSPKFRRDHGLALEDFCYYYETPYRKFDPELKALYDTLQHQVLRWWERFSTGRARLIYTTEGEGIVVRDSRFSDEAQIYRFGPAHRLIGEVLRAQYSTDTRLVKALGQFGIGENEAREALRDLTKARIVLEVEKEYVWVALEKSWIEQEDSRSLDYARINRAAVRNPAEWPEWEAPGIGSVESAPFPILT